MLSRMSDHPFSGVSFRDVIAYDRRTLEAIMIHGATPKKEELIDYEFRGYNPPMFARVLGFQKFVKGFFEDRKGLAGYNLFTLNPRSGPSAEWIAKESGKNRGRHGFYDVVPVKPGSRYDEFEQAVLLDYGSGRNSRLNPECRIRDYLVQVDPDNPELYLGKAYLDLGVTSVHSNFFVLERFRRTAA